MSFLFAAPALPGSSAHSPEPGLEPTFLEFSTGPFIESALKVKIIVSRANVRSKPAQNAPALMMAEKGQVFDVIDKVGDWYLVALPEGQQGYLSISVIEEIPETVKSVTAPSRPIESPPFRPEEERRRDSRRMDISFFGGFAMTNVNGASRYMDTWSDHWLTYVHEETHIAGSSKGSIFFGAGFSYFFAAHLGVQLMGGYLKSDVPTTSDFSYSYTWSATVGGGAYDRSTSWAGTGSLSVMPVCFNIAGRFGNEPLGVRLSGGPALFNNSIQESSTIGWGVSWYWTENNVPNQSIDAIAVAARIPKTSWTAIGFNAGAGLSYSISPGVALVVDGRYFFCPKKHFPWTLLIGTYDGVFYTTMKNIDFDADDADDALSKMTSFQVNPSFFQIAAGVKIVI